MNTVPLGLRYGRLVEIHEVARGRGCDCVCPGCTQPLIARQGTINRWHFAHEGESSCVPGGESWLHNAAKIALKERIDKAVLDRVPLPFVWDCTQCRKLHRGNLVRVAVRVELEQHSLGAYRPDLTIYDTGDQPRIAVEIVVSHGSEGPKLLEAQAREVPLFEIDVLDLSDLNRLRKGSPLRMSRAQAKCPKPPVDVWIGVSDKWWGAIWSGGDTIAGKTPEGGSGTAYYDAVASVLERLPPGSDVTIHSPISWMKPFVDDLRQRNGIPWVEFGQVKSKLAAQIRRHDQVEVLKVESNHPQTTRSREVAREHRLQAG